MQSVASSPQCLSNQFCSPHCSHPCCWTAYSQDSYMCPPVSINNKFPRSKRCHHSGASQKHVSNDSYLLSNIYLSKSKTLSIIDMSVNCSNFPDSSVKSFSSSLRRIQTSFHPPIQGFHGTRARNTNTLSKYCVLDSPILSDDPIYSDYACLQTTPFLFSPQTPLEDSLGNLGSNKKYSSKLSFKNINSHYIENSIPAISSNPSHVLFSRNFSSSSNNEIIACNGSNQAIIPQRFFYPNCSLLNLPTIHKQNFQNIRAQNLTDYLIAENYQDPSIIIKSYPKSNSNLENCNDSILEIIHPGINPETLQFDPLLFADSQNAEFSNKVNHHLCLTGKSFMKPKQPRNKSLNSGTVVNASSDIIFPSLTNCIHNAQVNRFKLSTSQLRKHSNLIKPTVKFHSPDPIFTHPTTISLDLNSFPDQSRRLPHIIQGFVSKSIRQASNESNNATPGIPPKSTHSNRYDAEVPIFNKSSNFQKCPTSAPPPTPDCFSIVNTVMDNSDFSSTNIYRSLPIPPTPNSAIHPSHSFTESYSIKEITIRVPSSTFEINGQNGSVDEKPNLQ